MISSPVLALRHRVALGVDDREVPAVQRQPDPHRVGAVEHGAAGHDRRLRRAVGVPDLAPLGLQPRRELGRARLPAHDQEADLRQRVARPQGDQRGDRRDDGDVVGDQPGPDVDAGADQGARAPAPGTRRTPRPATSPRSWRRTRPTGRPSPGPGGRSGACWRYIRASASTNAAALRWVDRHALGGARGPGGEDDPGVVLGTGPAQRRPDGSVGPGVAASPAHAPPGRCRPRLRLRPRRTPPGPARRGRRRRPGRRRPRRPGCPGWRRRGRRCRT